MALECACRGIQTDMRWLAMLSERLVPVQQSRVMFSIFLRTRNLQDCRHEKQCIVLCLTGEVATIHSSLLKFEACNGFVFFDKDLKSLNTRAAYTVVNIFGI